ncbi:MAG: hypothetical protein H6581_31320 [Bacteroidia bacterium]|nr:hypothetical protein [Bacteroidia bacterium]
MNFIAHFFLDRERPESFFAIGAATPDLLSIYNPRLRIKKHHIKKLNLETFSENDLMLLEGVKRHFHADAFFHTSPFFERETQWLSAQMTQRFPGDTIPRKYFIAHILLELVLDKALIHRHPDLLDNYYAHFTQSPLDQVRHATELVTKRELKNYDGFLAKFRDHKYLYNYTRWDHIVFVLKKIMERVSIAETEFTEMEEFMNLMKEFELRLENTHEEAFHEIIINS